MDAILRSRGVFRIRDLLGTLPEIALQISRNLHQYFGADTIISNDLKDEAIGSGNVIDVLLLPQAEARTLSTDGAHRCRQLCDEFLHLRHTRDNNDLMISLSLPDGREKWYKTPANSWGFSGAFLSPLENEQLSLIVWGTSKEALRFAARLVPMLTGTGQPDFIICDQRCTWKGAEGVLAMGSFDHEWNITRSSFVS